MIAEDGTLIHYIEDANQFAELCRQWTSDTHLALDTEFVRTNTFYPRVGLLQIADTTDCYLIDPLVVEDWSDFRTLLQGSSNNFVMHSCSEDLNLLQTAIGCIPNKIFDTQIAAAFLGLGFSLSYQALVGLLLGIELEKGETRSDWVRRPLSENQLLYAANDVTHLLELESILRSQLKASQKLQWFEDECSFVLSASLTAEASDNWQHLFINVNSAWKLNEAGLNALQRLCHWREVTARKRDKPRNWIAKDADLLTIAIEISEVETPTLETIKSLRLSDRRLLERNLLELFEAIIRDGNEFVAVNPQLLNKPLNSAGRGRLKSSQRLVAALAAELNIAPELLARKKLLNDLIRDFETTGELNWQGELAGWRRLVLEPALSHVFTDRQNSEVSG
ncbi:MAG: ribonuclease D [Proteobacteria bacterium]|nr:ribonuclease D [Pseudomonadota bacterium]